MLLRATGVFPAAMVLFYFPDGPWGKYPPETASFAAKAVVSARLSLRNAMKRELPNVVPFSARFGSLLQSRFHEVYLGFIPVFLIHHGIIRMKVFLIHAKCNENILRLSLLLIRIPILHAQLSHYAAAIGVVHIMRCRNIGKAIPLCLGKHRAARFCHNAAVPEFLH